MRKYYLDDKYKDIYFSAREVEVMMQLLRGHTATEIAGKLKLSPRTVEFYFYNMKRKVNVKSRMDFINVIVDSGLLFNADFA